MSRIYLVLSPDNFSTQWDEHYKTIKAARQEVKDFVKRYEAQGFYSTVKNGERVRIPLDQLADNCKIVRTTTNLI